MLSSLTSAEQEAIENLSRVVKSGAVHFGGKSNLASRAGVSKEVVRGIIERRAKELRREELECVIAAMEKPLAHALLEKLFEYVRVLHPNEGASN